MLTLRCDTVKLPFPLTLRFKVMLQRGIETPDLDVTWVSSLSWYFLTLFGLNAVYRLVLGDDNGESTLDHRVLPRVLRETDLSFCWFALQLLMARATWLPCRVQRRRCRA